MLTTTRAVVLRTFKYGDRSTVLKAFTEAFGTRGYLVRSKGKNDRTAAALQPLARVELVVIGAHDQEMHTVREIRVEKPYTALHTEPMRGMLALFTQEVFYRTLRQEAADPELFHFVQTILDRIDTGADISLYPVMLLTELSKHLGILPAPPAAGEVRFDLREGVFFSAHAPHELCMAEEQARLFGSVVSYLHGHTPVPGPGSAAVRRQLLDDLLIYYRLHVEGFGELRSPEVLHAMLH
jgi:DNA repair protein RecO (recombination protein O)